MVYTLCFFSSKCCLFHNSNIFGSCIIHILYIYSTNIGTEYFKHGIYSPFFPLQNAVCFIILTHLFPVLFTYIGTYSSNIGTEYFKHGIYSPFFPLHNPFCFIILTYFVPVLFTFYLQDVLKLKKNNSVAQNFKKIHEPIYKTLDF